MGDVPRDAVTRPLAATPVSDSEQLFRDLFDNAPVGYHELDIDGRVVRVNRTELSMLGWDETEMVGRFAWEFVVEEVSKTAIAAKIAGTLPLAPFERTFRCKDGSELPVLLEERLIYDASGKPSGIRTAVLDITARKAAERALQESEERYRDLVELSPDAIAVLTDGRIMFVNSAALRLLGANSSEELLGRPAMDFVHPDSREIILERAQSTRQPGAAVRLADHRLVALDGTSIDVEIAAMPFTHQGKTALQIVIRDVTKRKRAEEQIRKLAYLDALTGLPNRIVFNDRLAMALHQSHRMKDKVGLIFIDLDRFKVINDSLGHSFGDRLLHAAADRIRSCIREGDTLSRFGGDEFTLLLPGLQDAADAVAVAEKVLEQLRCPFRLEGREVFITASMGISLYPDDGSDLESLVKNSDRAMYRAKGRGRNNFVLFRPESTSVYP